MTHHRTPPAPRLPELILATCSYAAYRPPMGVPVRFTYTGCPPEYRKVVRHSLGEAVPDAQMSRLPDEQYRAEYQALLDLLGYAAVVRILHGILLVERADPAVVPVVLLTSADLASPGTACHRTIMARWWEANGGGPVAELAAEYVDELGTPAMF